MSGTSVEVEREIVDGDVYWYATLPRDCEHWFRYAAGCIERGDTAEAAKFCRDKVAYFQKVADLDDEHRRQLTGGAL